MKKKILIIILSIIIIIAIAICMSILWYQAQLKPVNSENAESKIIEIEAGTRTEQILDLLHENNLINNVLASEIYIKLNDVKGLQAGKYNLSTAMSLEQILKEISSGNVIDEQISITFLEGKNMRWIAQKIAEETNNTEEDVYNLLEDEEYMQKLVDKYWFLTDEILEEDIYYPLEGYLYPETYKFENADISVEKIFETLLDQTDKVLSKYQDQITASGGSVHQILTIASIIELEGKDAESRAGISSVIYNRLKSKMSLGSDVTTYYAIKVDMGERDLYVKDINTYNPYNTRGPNMAGKLPIGPIANVSEESINAALNPTDTDYLYFVADTNGKIYFSLTYEEHQSKIEELQKQGLWYEY
jgi:UPF0755 protein